MADCTGDGSKVCLLLRLGRFFGTDGPLRQPEIDAVAAQLQAVRVRWQRAVSRAPIALLGLSPLRAGLLRREDLQAALSRQTCELIVAPDAVGALCVCADPAASAERASDELGGALHSLIRRMCCWKASGAWTTGTLRAGRVRRAIYGQPWSATSELLRFGFQAVRA